MQKLFIFFVVFLFIFIEFFHPVTSFTQDLGRHLKLGQIILQAHTVPKTNLFSYTYQNFPFINTHWLSEVAFYLITQIVQLPGLLLVIATVAGLSMVIIVITSLELSEKPNYLAILFASILFSGILLKRTDLRPEVFSFLFMSIFMLVLYKHRIAYLQKKFSWQLLTFLPIIELLWVNTHIYFVIGPLLIFLFLIDALVINKVWTSAENMLKPSTKQYIFSLIVIFCITCITTLCNPNGLAGSLFPFDVFNNYGYTIAENQTIFFLINYGFRDSAYWYFGISVILVGILLVFKRKKTQPIDWMLFIFFTYIAYSAVRNLPLFVFATFPTVVALFPFDVSKRKNIQYFWLSILSLCFIFNLYLFISENGFGYSITSGADGGVRFFQQHNLHGPLFNNFDIGSYLDYRLYPQEKVFVDSRPEAYPASFLQNIYIPMEQNSNLFVSQDKKYHFSTIFFSHTDQTPWAKQFLVTMMQNSNWQLVYLDDFSAVWVKKSAYQSLSQKFAINENNFIVPTLQTTKQYMQLAYFLELIHWKKPEIIALEKLTVTDPNNCTALAILAQNPSTSIVYSLQYLSLCKR